MFGDLYDRLSMIFDWRWPTAEGEITEVDIEPVLRGRDGERLRPAVAYKFSLGDDGPYTGECFWEPEFSARLLSAKADLQVGQSVTVRYRPDNPIVNALDRRLWRDL